MIIIITIVALIIKIFHTGMNIQNRKNRIKGLSDSSAIRTHNHLVRKRPLNHEPLSLNFLSCVVSTYLYGAFDYMLLSRRIRVSE